MSPSGGTMYTSTITAGSLKVPQTRAIAGLLLGGSTPKQWQKALFVTNVLQTRSPATAQTLSHLITKRLRCVEEPMWKLIHSGSAVEATHACLAAAIKSSSLLGDFLDLVVRVQYRAYKKSLSLRLWADYLEECRRRDPNMPAWTENTTNRLRSSVFKILAEAGYICSTRTRTLQKVHIVKPVLRYLVSHNETYVLKCIEVGS